MKKNWEISKPDRSGSETGRLDRLDTEPDQFGTKPAGSVSNRSPIRLTNRFDPVWFRTGEPAGSGSGSNDF